MKSAWVWDHKSCCYLRQMGNLKDFLQRHNSGTLTWWIPWQPFRDMSAEASHLKTIFIFHSCSKALLCIRFFNPSLLLSTVTGMGKQRCIVVSVSLHVQWGDSCQHLSDFARSILLHRVWSSSQLGSKQVFQEHDLQYLGVNVSFPTRKKITTQISILQNSRALHSSQMPNVRGNTLI